MTNTTLQETERASSIRVQQLSRYYNSYAAVDKISFDVAAGSIFGLLGPNGAGKSTTIKMLTTLLPPTSGEAWVTGESIVTSAGAVRKNIGYVPQSLSADGELTGYENLLISAKLQGLKKDSRIDKISEVLYFMGLEEDKDKQVNRYSGGMIRRLEIAQALMHSPKVLFLDEPTVGLDPLARTMLWSYLQEWRRQNNVTIFLTTHYMEEADKLCETVAFMYGGRIIAQDSPANLKKSLGPKATLDNVFIHLTGTSVKERGDFQSVKQTRQNLSRMG